LRMHYIEGMSTLINLNLTKNPNLQEVELTNIHTFA